MARFSDEELIVATRRGEFDETPGNNPDLRQTVRRDLHHVRIRLGLTPEEWDVLTEADLLVLLKVLTEALAVVNKKLWTRQRQSLSRKKRGTL